MYYQRDKNGQKFFFIAIMVIVVYLAFFNFNIKAAYDYFVISNQWFFNWVASLF